MQGTSPTISQVTVALERGPRRRSTTSQSRRVSFGLHGLQVATCAQIPRRMGHHVAWDTTEHENTTHGLQMPERHSRARDDASDFRAARIEFDQTRRRQTPTVIAPAGDAVYYHSTDGAANGLVGSIQTSNFAEASRLICPPSLLGTLPQC